MAITRTWTIVGTRQVVECEGTRGAASAEDIAAAIDAHVTAEHP